jgi:hypothetical protein
MSGEERAGEEEEEARDGNDGDLLAVEGWPSTGWKVQRMCVGDKEGEKHEQSIEGGRLEEVVDWRRGKQRQRRAQDGRENRRNSQYL